MSVLISQYNNRASNHCGSGAMRNLLAFHSGLDLPEAAVFGLGSGLDALFIESPRLAPCQLLFGRGISMEQDVARALGIDYREHFDLDDERAWEAVKREVEAGHPTMLSGDVYYLDHREHKVHFPAHRFVLLGYDDSKEIAYVADRIHGEPQACSYQGLRLSRNPPEGISTYNLWGKFHDTTPNRDLDAACAKAIARTVSRMTGADTSQADMVRATAGNVAVASGLAGLERFAESFKRRDDKGDCHFWARYTARCIEDYGTGGGQFRLMYADFLEWARERVADRVPRAAIDSARESAVQWTRLSEALHGIADQPDSEVAWSQCQSLAYDILRTEQAMVEALARAAETLFKVAD